MVLQEKGAEALPLGLYVHVPFCATQCDFCAFYQEPPRRGDIERYLDGIEKELLSFRLDRRIDTVFWGGGTPALLPAKDLARLADAVLETVSMPPEEWTVELAPSAVKADKVRVLKAKGVTRFSLGVQSFQKETLETLGRQHSLKQIDAAIDCLRNEGVRNLNLDLIFAVPGQSAGDWEKDLEEAVRRGPEHVSTYCLTFEEDTALFLRASQGKVAPKGEEEESRFYLAAMDVLEADGFHQYEISNFAREGFACRHNVNTWRMAEWIGCGPSAASQYSDRRWANVPSLDDWLAGLETGGQPMAPRDDPAGHLYLPGQADMKAHGSDEPLARSAGAGVLQASDRPDRGVKPLLPVCSKLTNEILAGDCVVFGLRMNEGVNLAELAARFRGVPLDGLEPLWRDLEEEGLLGRPGDGRICLTKRGRLLADRIAVEVLDRLESLADAQAR